MDNLEPITRNEMFLNGDDLEPITREEMILAGADLEPITRHEWFLKKYRGGGGGGGYDLVNIPNLPADIASFNDGTDLPMASLKVAVTPYQDLHGYDGPWAGGAGKNKLQVKATSQTVGGVTFTINNDGTINVNGTATQNITLELSRKNKNGTPLPQGDLIMNGCPSGGSTSSYYLTCWRTNNGNADDVGEGIQFSYQSDWDFVVSLVILSGTTCNNLTFKPMIRLASVTDATFEPYSNICPIIGWDEAVVTVADDAESPTTSHEYTIDLDGTRYGSELDVLNGVDIDTLGSVDLGTLNYSYYSGDLFTVRISDLKPVPNEVLCDALCSIYVAKKGNEYSSIDGSFVAGFNNSPVLAIHDSRFSDATAFKQAMNGVQLVYELATPITVQLAPTAIKSIEGENNISANCGQITEVKYFKKA